MFQNRNPKLEGCKDPNGISPTSHNMGSSFLRVCALVRIRNDVTFVKSLCPMPSPNVSTKQSKRPNFCRVQRGFHLIVHHRMYEEKLCGRSLNNFFLSSHLLEVETGRCIRQQREQRFCQACKRSLGLRVLGDEQHALSSCVRAALLRSISVSV